MAEIKYIWQDITSGLVLLVVGQSGSLFMFLKGCIDKWSLGFLYRESHGVFLIVFINIIYKSIIILDNLELITNHFMQVLYFLSSSPVLSHCV